MMWQEIYFDKMIQKNEFIIAISNTFDIKYEDVRIIAEFDELDNEEKNYRVLCQTFLVPKNNKYKFRVDFIVDDDLIPENDIEVFSKMIRLLDCQLLVDNYSEIPNTMLEIKSNQIDWENFDSAETMNSE